MKCTLQIVLLCVSDDQNLQKTIDAEFYTDIVGIYRRYYQYMFLFELDIMMENVNYLKNLILLFIFSCRNCKFDAAHILWLIEGD